MKNKWYKIEFYAELSDKVVDSLDPQKHESLADIILKASKLDEFIVRHEGKYV